jgi:hypothetical protein
MNTSTRILLPLAALAGLTLTVNGCAGSPSAPHNSASALAPTTASAAAPTTASPSASPSVPHYATALATVRAYYSAINSRNYARAWHLGGRFTGSSYSTFAAGFQGTAHDKVTILSVTGSVVTARLAAQQTDGSVRTYQGTYWVTDGVITRFAVALSPAESSPPPSSAAPAGCYPTAPSGNCYEPGEYCPTADAGMSGVAGDGKTITCVMESGRYHWHPGG